MNELGVLQINPRLLDDPQPHLGVDAVSEYLGGAMVCPVVDVFWVVDSQPFLEGELGGSVRASDESFRLFHLPGGDREV